MVLASQNAYGQWPQARARERVPGRVFTESSPGLMSEIRSDSIPRSRRPSRRSAAGRCSSIRRIAGGSIQPSSCRPAPRSGDVAPLRGQFRRRIDRRRGRSRLPDHAGAFPALLCRRQPRALRARPADVRRPAAVVCQYPLDAGGRRARHRGPGRRRRTGNLRSAHFGRRSAPRIDGLYKPYHRMLRRRIHAAAA